MFLGILDRFPWMRGGTWVSPVRFLDEGSSRISEACFLGCGDIVEYLRHVWRIGGISWNFYNFTFQIFLHIFRKFLNISGMIPWRGEVLEYQTYFSDEGNFFVISGRSPRMGYQTTYHKWQNKTKCTASWISWPERHILNWHQCSSWQMLCVSDRGVNSSFSQYLKGQVTWFALLARNNPEFPSA